MGAEEKVAEVQWENLGGFFSQDVTKTFKHFGDEMPSDDVFGQRIKHVHAQGTVAKAAIKRKAKSPYTGLFEGADDCIIRLSVTHFITPWSHEEANPSVSLKCFRDGVPSGNIVTTESAQDNREPNFFRAD